MNNLNMSFCHVKLGNQVEIEPSIYWKAEAFSDGLFVIYGDHVPVGAVVTINDQEKTLWKSEIRLKPEHVDATSVLATGPMYITNSLIQIADTVDFPPIVNISLEVDERVIKSTPLWIINEDNRVEDKLVSDWPRERLFGEYEDGIIEKELIARPVSVATIDKYQPMLEIQEPSNPAPLSIEATQDLVKDFLVEGTPFFLSYDTCIQVEERPALPNIVVERIGNQYVTVLNDLMNRPIYFLPYGEHLHGEGKSINEYQTWLQEQLIKMYNIPVNEIEAYNILWITEENIDNSISRSDALSLLGDTYPSVFDNCNDETTLIITEEQGTQAILRWSGQDSHRLFDRVNLKTGLFGENEDGSFNSLAWEMSRWFKKN
jgi:hypothetical protein